MSNAMSNPVVHFTSMFMAYFAIMNPVANSSLFVTLTQDLKQEQQRAVALRAVGTALVIVVLFTLAGREIFSLFGITLPAFRIAGGVMISIIGYHMLQGENTRFHHPAPASAEEAEEAPAIDIAITPLGTPLLAGPGTITTTMNFAAGSTFAEVARMLVAFGLICALTYLAFRSGPWLARTLGRNAIKVISRLMGLILAVVGVQMLLDGIRGAAIF